MSTESPRDRRNGDPFPRESSDTTPANTIVIDVQLETSVTIDVQMEDE